MDIVKVLQYIRPGEQWVLHGQELTWLDSTPRPTEAELQEGVRQLELQSYMQKRAAEYPPIVDQLDAIWKGGEDMEAMRQQILAIKAKYPAPTEINGIK